MAEELAMEDNAAESGGHLLCKWCVLQLECHGKVWK